MPLLRGSSNDVVHQNYKELKASGRPDAQSWAIALQHAGKRKPRKHSSKAK